jgi:hypothetical protein
MTPELELIERQQFEHTFYTLGQLVKKTQYGEYIPNIFNAIWAGWKIRAEIAHQALKALDTSPPTEAEMKRLTDAGSVAWAGVNPQDLREGKAA